MSKFFETKAERKVCEMTLIYINPTHNTNHINTTSTKPNTSTTTISSDVAAASAQQQYQNISSISTNVFQEAFYLALHHYCSTQVFDFHSA